MIKSALAALGISALALAAPASARDEMMPWDTPVLVNGVMTQVLGDATMDMMMVDLSPLPHARVGDPVVLWGEGLPVETIARCARTIPYDLLCRMRMRAHFVELDA